MERLLLGLDAINLHEKEGFSVLTSKLARAEDEATKIALEIGFPVVLKVLSPDVVHKTEVGGVRAFINTEDELREAFRGLVEDFTTHNPEKRLDGIMVQGMGRGLELIVGVLKDQQFGPVLMFGLGGIFVEAIRDVSFRLLPIETKDAREMIEELNAYRILTSPRWKGIDIAMIEDFLLKVSGFTEREKGLQEMDLNPVFVSSSGIEICDARLKIDSP
jgi:acyl-CoA synthetase (NDP forming)